jgi:transposase-like protein
VSISRGLAWPNQRNAHPSAQIEAAIEAALLNGTAGPDQLSELGRLGARLILQRAVEDEVATFLGRLRYERTPEAAGSRNGTRPRRVQTPPRGTAAAAAWR